jgi:hypothetical protein
MLMVLPDRIELSASPLPRGCSTTELRQPERTLEGENGAAPERCASTATRLFSTQGQKALNKAFIQPKYAFSSDEHFQPMTKSQQAEQRAQRLAAKLRENLKRRKGQIKARGDAHAAAPEETHGGADDEAKKP